MNSTGHSTGVLKSPPASPCSRLQRFILLTRLEPDDTGLLLGPGALRPVWTRRAVLPSKAGLPPHATLGRGVRVPGDALLAHGARHHLLVPVDQKLCLIEPRT